jgi:hypothetical protein
MSATLPDVDYRTIPAAERKADFKTNAAAFFMGGMALMGALYSIYLAKCVSNGTLHTEFAEAIDMKPDNIKVLPNEAGPLSPQSAVNDTAGEAGLPSADEAVP